jgi:hypothetical protein
MGENRVPDSVRRPASGSTTGPSYPQGESNPRYQRERLAC